ncbi:hypothetical protein [Actinoplanes sp. HUAS TT8]|uniref:hypothetical protein n=1 Tax=Actinoplanes sp. HUAS TT8 TaxID=3447453 RepID=UPI003F52142C
MADTRLGGEDQGQYAEFLRVRRLGRTVREATRKARGRARVQRDRPALYASCSPHKVAQIVPHLRSFYDDDFAAELVAVLPAWIRLLAEQTGLADDLTERCLSYASGEKLFPGLCPNPMARPAE